MKQISSIGVGLKGNLVDKDGFPIDDVNKILLVRELRNKLASKNNFKKEDLSLLS